MSSRISWRTSTNGCGLRRSTSAPTCATALWEEPTVEARCGGVGSARPDKSRARVASFRCGRRRRVHHVVVPQAAPNVTAPEASGMPPRRWGAGSPLPRAASLLSVIGFAVWTRADRGVTLCNGDGEQRSRHADRWLGGAAQLQSRLRVSFSEQIRTVELIDGQALFEVAKNPARPFVVVSGKTSVRAVGTQFDVYRKSAGTVVTVLEGPGRCYRASTRTPSPASKSSVLPGGRSVVIRW